MTTGRINQVSAYHLRPAVCTLPTACTRRQGHKRHQHNGFVQTNQQCHKSIAPTHGLPFRKQRQGTRQAECMLRCPDFTWKASANTADFTDTHTAQQVQTHKLELLKHQSALQFEAALLTTHNRDRMRRPEDRCTANTTSKAEGTQTPETRIQEPEPGTRCSETTKPGNSNNQNPETRIRNHTQRPEPGHRQPHPETRNQEQHPEPKPQTPEPRN
jgi:hypothetical protein